MIYVDDKVVDTYEELQRLFHDFYDNDEAHRQAQWVWGHDDAFSPDRHICVFLKTSAIGEDFQPDEDDIQ